MKLLKCLYRLHSPSRYEGNVQKFIMDWLKRRSIEFTYDNAGNILAVKGKAETYPCIVSHMDEVHTLREKDYTVMKNGDVLFGFSAKQGTMQGIGADDKNGIWVALKLLEEEPAMKAVFFVEEEIGCNGSRKVDMSFFKDCRYVLQCDRKGASDFITNISGIDLCSDAFVRDMNLGKHSYNKSIGFMTDVLELKKRGLKVSAVNVSCGYYAPHTNGEYTRFSELVKCLKMLQEFVETHTDVYPHDYVPPVIDNSYAYYKGGTLCGSGEYYSNYGYSQKGLPCIFRTQRMLYEKDVDEHTMSILKSFKLKDIKTQLPYYVTSDIKRLSSRFKKDCIKEKCADNLQSRFMEMNMAAFLILYGLRAYTVHFILGSPDASEDKKNDKTQDDDAFETFYSDEEMHLIDICSA